MVEGKYIDSLKRVFCHCLTFFSTGRHLLCLLISSTKSSLCTAFYIPCIVKYMPIIVQQQATMYSLFRSANRSTCFGWYLHPSSGTHVTVSTPSGISKTVTASCNLSWTWLELSSRPVTFTTGCSYSFTNARCCGYSDMCSWWWVEIPPEICRAVCRYKNNCV